MAAIDWPSGLPVALLGSLNEGSSASYVNDESQVGRPRRRRRFTRTLKTFSFELTLTNAQATTLRTFVDTTSAGGVSEFNWTHPVTAVAYEMRFVDLPQITQQTANAWRAGIVLEEI
jgi:hypothetical protein